MVEKNQISTETDARNGFIEKLRAATPTVIKDNAPRIVAGMKTISSLVAMSSGSRLMKVSGLGFLAAFGTVIAFGKKKTEEEKQALREEKEAEKPEKPRGRVAEFFHKITHPRRYPIETGAAISAVASAFWMLAGVAESRKEKEGGEGKKGVVWSQLIAGAFSLASDANIAFTKEQIGGESNPHPKGSLKYRFRELRNRPVLFSSLMSMGTASSSAILGAKEAFFDKEKGEKQPFYIGVILLIANAFQAIYVNKNDYNVEEKSDEAELKPAQVAGAEPEETPWVKPATMAEAKTEQASHQKDESPKPKAAKDWGERMHPKNQPEPAAQALTT